VNVACPVTVPEGVVGWVEERVRWKDHVVGKWSKRRVGMERGGMSSLLGGGGVGVLLAMFPIKIDLARTGSSAVVAFWSCALLSSTAFTL